MNSWFLSNLVLAAAVGSLLTGCTSGGKTQQPKTAVSGFTTPAVNASTNPATTLVSYENSTIPAGGAVPIVGPGAEQTLKAISAMRLKGVLLDRETGTLRGFSPAGRMPSELMRPGVMLKSMTFSTNGDLMSFELASSVSDPGCALVWRWIGRVPFAYCQAGDECASPKKCVLNVVIDPEDPTGVTWSCECENIID